MNVRRSNTPEVSVVIPTRDRAALLARTLASVLAQHDVDLEVLVVHDGPDRGGLLPVRDLGDSRVRALATATQAGDGATRNAGVRAAAGEWVAYCDDDDLWSPTKLRDQIAAAGSHAGFAYSAVVSIDEQDRVIAEFPAPSAVGLQDALLARNAIPAGGSNVIVRRDAMHDIGGWDEQLVQFSDWDMWIRLAAALEAAAALRVGVAYVQHLGARSLSPSDELFREFHRVNAKHAATAAKRGVVPDEVAFTRFVAERQRRAGRSLAAARLYVSAARGGRSVRDLALAGHAITRLPVPKRRRPTQLGWIRRPGPDAAVGQVPSGR